MREASHLKESVFGTRSEDTLRAWTAWSLLCGLARDLNPNQVSGPGDIPGHRERLTGAHLLVAQQMVHHHRAVAPQLLCHAAEAGGRLPHGGGRVLPREGCRRRL